MLPGRVALLPAGLLLAVLLLSGAPAHAQWRLIGCDFEGNLYDVDPGTGAATNPRATGIPTLAGIAYSPDGLLYGLSTFGGSNEYPKLVNCLFRIDPDTGASTRVGQTGFDVAEGDLAFDPATGNLYGLAAVGYGSGTGGLVQIDPQTGQGTLTALVAANANISGMNFFPDGRLFVMVSSFGTSEAALMQVDPGTGAILQTDELGITIGVVGGMAYDITTQILYLTDGERSSTKILYSYDSAGTLTEIGPTGAPCGISGLSLVPEPSVGLLLMALCPLWRRRKT